ncbi:MAG TPA: MFS transporter, partial [Thermomicrobiales bacterium]|nr:MFS transporter [Thermomicrobiales bacterium]
MHLRARLQTGVWQLRSFRLLISASMVSIFGSLITVTAFPFIAINALDAGPADLALLSLAGIVPGALLGSVAGVWVERRPPKIVMITADLTCALALLTVPLLWWAGSLSMGLLLAVALVTSLAELGFRVADRTLLPSVVGREQIESANATLSGGSALAEAGGFSFGGLLIQVLNGPLALLVDVFSFIGSAILLSRIRIDVPITSEDEEQNHTHWRTALREGIQYLRQSPVLSPLAGSLFLQAAGMEAIGTVYFLFVNK